MTARRTKPALSEAARQAAIMLALAGLGRIVFRVQSGKVKVRGGWMVLAPNGTPDLYVLGWGWLECKAEKATLSKAQKGMHAFIRAAGERVATVRTPAEAIAAVMGRGAAKGCQDG